MVYFFTSLIFYLVLFFVLRFFWQQAKINQSQKIKSIHNCSSYDWLVAGLIYSLCTIIFFYSNLKVIDKALIGAPGDNLEHFWDIFWIKQVFFKNKSIFFTNYLYYPQGTSLLFHPISFYNVLLGFLLTYWLNSVIVYNLLILHSFLLAGIGAFFLIRYLTKDPYSSLIGGFIFAFSPFHFAQAQGHIESSTIQFIPFFVLFFLKITQTDSKKDLALASLFFFLNAISSWYFFSYGLIFVALAYCYQALKLKKVILKKLIVKYLIVVGTTILILSPWISKMAIAALKNPQIAQKHRGCYNLYLADAISFFCPTPYQLSSGFSIVEKINEKTKASGIEGYVYLGMISILLVGFTFRNIKNITAKYFLGLIIFLVLAMGRKLHFLGDILPVSLPYGIIKNLPFFAAMRVPARFIVFVYLFWAIITSFAIRYLKQSLKPIKRSIVLVLVSLLLFLDYFYYYDSQTEIAIPKVYDFIKSDNSQFAILDLPNTDSHYPSKMYMTYQTYHQKPIVGGWVERRINDSLLDNLELKNLITQKKQLLANKVKYIFIHKKFISDKYPLDILEYKKIYSVIYEDNDYLACKLFV